MSKTPTTISTAGSMQSKTLRASRSAIKSTTTAGHIATAFHCRGLARSAGQGSPPRLRHVLQDAHFEVSDRVFVRRRQVRAGNHWYWGPSGSRKWPVRVLSVDDGCTAPGHLRRHAPWSCSSRTGIRGFVLRNHGKAWNGGLPTGL